MDTISPLLPAPQNGHAQPLHTIPAGIIGLGHYEPARILTNFDLEKMVETNDEWIRDRTGIAQRHIVADDESTADIAFNAAQKALENANIGADEIDLIIVA